MMAKKKRAINSFQSKKHEDFTIVDNDGLVVGKIRIKPSSVLWSPKGGHGWYGVSLSEFSKYAEEKGKKQTK